MGGMMGVVLLTLCAPSYTDYNNLYNTQVLTSQLTFPLDVTSRDPCPSAPHSDR